MKANKSPEATEVTPSKKKLKQAVLPFKIINESPSAASPVTPESRKRKLSATEAETVAKVNKICKENEDDLVVISDDESTDGKPNEKHPNPYVKLVDAARKKKLQKSKAGKKKKTGKKDVVKVTENGLTDGNDTVENDEDMQVDDHVIQNNVSTTKSTNKKDISKETANTVEVNESIVLEDSNSSDIKQTADKLVTNPSDDNSCKNNDNNDENAVGNNSGIEDNDSENSETSDDVSNKEVSVTNKEETTTKKEGSVPNNEESFSNNKEPVLNEELPVTPKRSSRVRAKLEENNNKGSPSSKLNESLTPSRSRSSSATKMDESLNESATSNTTLTPKQVQKKMESAKKREEREKERLEREKKRQQEKDERAKQKQEKEEQKKREREEKEEAKRKEKEEKEEQRKKEKEEKEKQKEMEKKLREEKEEQKKKEKEEKEEQRKKEREAKEEEKRKKQEAVELEKQEQEMKKKKAAEAFLNFFVPKQKVDKDQPTVGNVNNSMLTNFTIKSDMRLAPTTRVCLTEDKVQTLERFIKEQNVEESLLYLKKLKSGDCKPLSSGKTWPLTDKDDEDVILVEDELPPIGGALETVTCEPLIREKLRPKLFSFHENRRPPYWGTWRKKSAAVKPRRPFGQDQKQLDYEVDSDEEWEEEQEGESIDGSAAGSDDEQGPDEYEVDNEVFVPHGYLSDEEATMDEDDVLSLSPETQKQRLKHLEDEFESEMKKPTEKLKPRLYGLLWETSDGSKPDNCVDAIWNYFGKLSMIMNDPTTFMQPSNEPEEHEKKKVKKKKATEGDNSPKTEKKKRKIEEKDKPKVESKKVSQDTKKNQPGINMFLAKIKPT